MKNRFTRALVFSLMTALAPFVLASLSSGSIMQSVRAQTPTHAPGPRQKKEGETQPAAAKKPNEATGKLPVVREMDLAALKKLLQRDATTTGARPLLVNFWATWCEPCREEFPDLVKIDEQYGAARLDFITISLDDVSDIEKGVPQYLQQMRARMPAYLLNVDDPETVINLVDPKWTGAMPATFLFDAHGALVFKHTGRIKPDELRTAIEAVVSVK
jgi:thiol-disulfide isomerase/thioredoxin